MRDLTVNNVRRNLDSENELEVLQSLALLLLAVSDDAKNKEF